MQKLMLKILLFLFIVGCKTPGRRLVAYKVRLEKGDTLSSLAVKYDTTWKHIAKLNKLGSNPTLQIGQIILIRPGTSALRLSSRINRPASKKIHQNSAEQGRGGLLYGGSSGAIVWPVQGVVTSEYGRRHGRQHSGIDIGAKRGTSIKSVKAGVVVFVGWKRGYGRTVVVNHGSFKTLYAHCSTLLVKNRQVVRPGQRIARVGRSGNARGYHLHFEYRNKNDQAMNPRRILRTQSLSSL